MAIALDRQEKATENGVDVEHSAVQYVRNQLGMQGAPLPSWQIYCFISKNGGRRCASITSGLCISPKYGVTEG